MDSEMFPRINNNVTYSTVVLVLTIVARVKRKNRPVQIIVHYPGFLFKDSSTLCRWMEWRH